MSINDTIRDLDDAREYYKRIKGYDKLAKKLVVGGIGTATAGISLAMAFNNGGFVGLLVPAVISVFVGSLLWGYVNLDEEETDYYDHRSRNGHMRCDRMTAARKDLSNAEKAHEKATMGDVS